MNGSASEISPRRIKTYQRYVFLVLAAAPFVLAAVLVSARLFGVGASEPAAAVSARTDSAAREPTPPSPLELPPPQVLDDSVAPQTGRREFLGAEACGECHQEIFETFQQTAHHRTSAPANAHTIHGNFAEGKNVLKTSNPALVFYMEQRADGFYQTARVRTRSGWQSHTEQFAIVTGSGKVAQTYLYYRGMDLFELPVSYLKALDCWITSPGFQEGMATFDRHVLGGCLQCHVTYYDPFVDPSKRGTPEHIIYGISCERCHGPGRRHVEFHREHPDEEEARYIVHPASLSVERQMDICGQCHCGTPVGLYKPAFSYRPGEPLEEYLILKSTEEQNEIGVHVTSQAARLANSPCFQQSDAMTCTTCHDPHYQEHGNLRLFSRRCMRCHDVHQCGAAKQLGQIISNNCVDCHMPLTPDAVIHFRLADGRVYYPPLRDHAIGIYPEISQQIIKLVRQMQQQREKPAEPRRRPSEMKADRRGQ